MTPKRKKAQESFIEAARKHNLKQTIAALEYLFSTLNDQEFNKLMENIRDGKVTLPFIVPHEETADFDEHAIIKDIEALGGLIEQRTTTVSKKFGEFKSNTKKVVLDISVKRAAQTADKKQSVSKGTKVSPISGQVTGESKSSTVTMQEKQLLQGFGLKNIVSEFDVPRGGDLGSGRAMNTLLFNTGRASLREVKEFSTGVESTQYIKALWKASHIDSTL